MTRSILLLAAMVMVGGCKSPNPDIPIAPATPIEVEKESKFQLSEIHSVYVAFKYNDDGEKSYIWINGMKTMATSDICVSSSGIITVDLKGKRKYTVEVER